jgi:hypothetical protein
VCPDRSQHHLPQHLLRVGFDGHVVILRRSVRRVNTKV